MKTAKKVMFTMNKIKTCSLIGIISRIKKWFGFMLKIFRLVYRNYFLLKNCRRSSFLALINPDLFEIKWEKMP